MTGPLSSVDEEFAWNEGEDDRTRADIAVVFERFAVVYPAIGA